MKICYVKEIEKRGTSVIEKVYFPNKLFEEEREIILRNEAIRVHNAYYLEFDDFEDVLDNVNAIESVIDKFDYPLDKDYAISFSFDDKEAFHLLDMVSKIKNAFDELGLNFDEQRVINLLVNAVNHSTSINLFVFFNYKKLFEKVMKSNAWITLEYKEGYVIWHW